MKLRDAKQLTVELTELLEQGKHMSQKSTLAGRYNDACQVAAQRLSQCITMIENGNMTGCIQLAGTAPSLTQLIAVLKFDALKKWRARCDLDGLEIPPEFNESFLRKLISVLLEEDTIGPDHPLSKDFSRHMMAKDIEAAYAVLCVILEKDSKNQSANKIKPDLEKQVLRLRGTKLQECISRNDLEGVNRVIEETEGLPFADTGRIDCWVTGKNLQCQLWTNQIYASRAANDWKTSCELLKKLDEAMADNPGVQDPGEAYDWFKEARIWTINKEKEWTDELEYNNALEQLTTFMAKQEHERMSGVRRKIGEIQEIQKELNDLWDALESLGRAIPRMKQVQFEEASSALSREVVRVRRRMRILTATCSLLILTLVAGTVVSVFAWKAGPVEMTSLDSLKAEKRVVEMEKKLENTRLKWLKGILVGGFSAKIRECENYVEDERVKEEETRELIQQLEKEKKFDGIDVRSDREVGAIGRKFVDVTNRIAALSPDFVEEMKVGIRGCYLRWEDRLSERKQGLTKEYDELLKEMKGVEDAKLGKGVGFEIGRQGLTNMNESALKWRQLTNGKIKILAPNTNHLVQYGQLVKARDNAQSNIGSADAIMGKMKDACIAGNLPDYIKHLPGLMSNYLIPEKDKGAIQTIVDLKISAEVVQTQLFAPGTNLPPAFLSALNRPVSFISTNAVKSDDNASKIWDKLLNANHVKFFKPELIWVQTTDDQEIVYWDLREAPRGQLFFLDRPFKHFKHKRGQVDWRKENVSAFFENQVWKHDKVSSQALHPQRAVNELGIRQIADATAGVWKTDILTVLEKLHQFGINNCGLNISNLKYSNETYLAYLAGQLFKIMDKDPYGWGLAWSPNAQLEYRHLKKLGVDRMNDAPIPDWMRFSYRTQFLDKKNESMLVKLFVDAENARSRPDNTRYSLKQQATAFHSMLQKAYNGGKNVKFFGFVDGKGNPVQALKFTPGTVIIGYGIEGKLKVLFKENPQNKAGVKVNEPQPFTPLFNISGGREELLKGYKGMFGVIPPSILPKYFTLR